MFYLFVLFGVHHRAEQIKHAPAAKLRPPGAFSWLGIYIMVAPYFTGIDMQHKEPSRMAGSDVPEYRRSLTAKCVCVFGLAHVLMLRLLTICFLQTSTEPQLSLSLSHRS